MQITTAPGPVDRTSPLPHCPIAIYAVQGMSEPRGRLAQCSVSLHAVLAASLGAHRKAQHARVCFARRPLLYRQRLLRECRCSARSAKRLAESSLGNCMLGVWLCPSRSRAPGGTRGGTGCKGAHHRSRYSPFRHGMKAYCGRGQKSLLVPRAGRVGGVGRSVLVL